MYVLVRALPPPQGLNDFELCDRKMTVVAGFAAESETQAPLPAVLAAMQQPPVSASSASLSSAPLLPMGGMVSAYTPQPLGAMLFGAPPQQQQPPPSAYLAMCNMFDAAEMSDDDYQDVEDDARDGCAAFGEVVALKVERGSAV
jgi:hypothetical protein